MRFSTSGWLLPSTLLILSACATEPLVLPDEGPTSKEVYEGVGGMSASPVGNGQLNPHDVLPYEPHQTAWSREQSNELEQLFPLIPNRQIKGYVFPHLTSRGHPVPGYTTGFYLYEEQHYALPGEVPAARIPPRLRKR